MAGPGPGRGGFRQDGPPGGAPPAIGLPKALPRALRYLRPYWRSTTAALIGLILVAVATLSSPQLIRFAVDRGIAQQDAQVLILTTAGLVAVAAVRGFATFLQSYGSERAAQGLAFEMRDSLFAHIQRQSFSYYDQMQTGQLLTRVTSDVEQVRAFAGLGLLQLMSALVQLFGAIAVMLAFNWRLALLALLPIPFVFLLTFRFLAKAGPVFGRLQQKIGELTTVLQENIAGVRVVRTFVRERVEAARFDRVNHDIFDQAMETLQLISLNFPIVFFLGNIGGVLVLLFGGMDVIGGSLTVGELIAFNSYLAFLLFPILSLGFLVVGAARADASAIRIFEVLDSSIEVRDKDGAIDLPPIDGRVEFDHVSFRYPGDQRPILSNISFVAEPGQTIAILGATGSGKSTVVNLLPRFYDVTGGAVRVDGHDVREVTLQSLRQQIGIVLQDTQLIRGTIRDNIAFGRPDATEDEIRRAAEAAQAAGFIAEQPQGYDTVVGDRGVGLSGGQKQRIAIARALLVHPKLLILDDSTSAVDAATEARIQEALDSLIRDRNSTVFVIAQRVSTVRDADLILLLDNGALVASGTHEDLLADSPLYNEILGSQLRPDRPLAGIEES